MSRKTFTHSCGHAGEVFIPGSGYGKQVAYLAEQGENQLCPACRAKAAQEAASAAGLPTLEGSDKQIAWAADVRPVVIGRAEQLLASEVAKLGDRAQEPVIAGNLQKARANIERLRTITKASWWIDNRSLDALFVLMGRF